MSTTTTTFAVSVTDKYKINTFDTDYSFPLVDKLELNTTLMSVDVATVDLSPFDMPYLIVIASATADVSFNLISSSYATISGLGKFYAYCPATMEAVYLTGIEVSTAYDSVDVEVRIYGVNA